MSNQPTGIRLGQFEVITSPIVSDVTVDYVCLDHEKSRPALLRSLRPELRSSQTARDRFAQSGAAWVALGDHPHIVRCYDVLQLENSDETYLVLQAVVPKKEHANASLLQWLIPGQSLPVLQSLLFALQIARGMRHVATLMPGFVHGDLKPENVLVGEGRLMQANVNRLRVTDFGLTAVLSADDVDFSQLLRTGGTAAERTQVINGIVGTPLYMSPERWRGETAGAATDVYALGCFLYKMLVGRLPVEGEKTEHLRSAHCMGNVRPFPAGLPDCVIDLNARCLALKPSDRYQSWEEVEMAIAAVYEETTKYPVPAAEPTDTPTNAERVVEGWFLKAMGYACSEAGNLNTAVECFNLALKVGIAEGDKALVGDATDNLGVTYGRLSDTQRAIEHHEKALTIASETGDRSLQGSALHNLGLAYLQLGNPSKAVRYIEQALAFAREIHAREKELAALTNMGNVYHQLGDLSRSIQYHEEALTIGRNLGDRRGQSAALANLGAVYLALDNNRRAIQYLEQCQAITSEIGHRQAQIGNLTNLGNAYRNLHDARRAFEFYDKALEIAREMGNRRGEASALNNMGSTYSNTGKMGQAIEHHEQALAIFREIGDRRSEGDCLTNLGFIYISRHDTKRAMEYCEGALAIDREVGDIFGLALDSFNMANLLAKQDRFREALAYAEESANILERIGHPKASEARQRVTMINEELASQEARADNKVTRVPADLRQQILRVRRDNPQLAANMSDEDIILLLQQADLTIEHGKPMVFRVQRPEQAQESADRPDPQRMSAQECQAYGEQLLVAGRWSEAERYFLAQWEKSKETADLGQQASAQQSLGRIYSLQGNADQAFTLYRRALSLAEKAHEHRLIASIHNDIGEAYRGQGEYHQAIAYYNKSLEIALGKNCEELLAAIYGNIGIIHKNQGQFDQAIQAYERSLKHSIGQRDDRLTAHQYANLGNVYGLQGHHAQALQVLQKAQEIGLRIGDQKAVANNYGNLGVIHQQIGNYPLALEMYRKALRIMRELGDERGTALIHSNMAVVYQALGDMDQALSYYREALPLSERLGDKHNMARLHLNLGRFYKQQSQSSQARVHLLEAKALFEKVGDRQSAQAADQDLRRL